MLNQQQGLDKKGCGRKGGGKSPSTNIGLRQVISARKGEFETGFDRGGQTREHAMLAKTAGVSSLIVVINKMDDPTVEWAEARLVRPTAAASAWGERGREKKAEGETHTYVLLGARMYAAAGCTYLALLNGHDMARV